MKHFNPSIAEDINRIFDLKSFDSVSELGEIIQPVVLIQRRCNVVKRVTATNTTTAIIYTTPSDKDFYLIAAYVSMIKDATSTSLYSRIILNIDGVSSYLCEIVGLTLTPQENSVSLSFSNPIKVDRGSAITIQNSTNVANITSTGGIIGFTVETVKAT